MSCQLFNSVRTVISPRRALLAVVGHVHDIIIVAISSFVGHRRYSDGDDAGRSSTFLPRTLRAARAKNKVS